MHCELLNLHFLNVESAFWFGQWWIFKITLSAIYYVLVVSWSALIQFLRMSVCLCSQEKYPIGERKILFIVYLGALCLQLIKIYGNLSILKLSLSFSLLLLKSQTNHSRFPLLFTFISVLLFYFFKFNLFNPFSFLLPVRLLCLQYGIQFQHTQNTSLDEKYCYCYNSQIFDAMLTKLIVQKIILSNFSP